MKSDCIFCKIIAGELPCTKIYEDDKVLAFLDIGPVVKGHTLVIPRAHHDPLMETPNEVLASLMIVVRNVARALTKGLSANAINVTQANGKLAGQEVPHIHFHVIPRFDTDAKNHRNWIPDKYDSQEEMETIGESIRAAMED